MNRFKAFIQTVFIGGVAVLLPIVILILVFSIIFKFATGLIEPLTHLLVEHFNIPGILADVVVIILILLVAFLVGLLVKTKWGHMLHAYLERKFLENTPGYKMIKETTEQLMSGKQSPLSKVALVKPFGDESLMTAFITHEHQDGSFTVFVPMSPPTSGFVFHLKASLVHPVDVSTEEAMKTMIGLGTGSGKLMEKFNNRQNS
jgi:uncharacterized membrane protein